MTPFFAFPLAFAAGAALIAALVAIYVLRNRLPTIEVSSLFLWAAAPKTKEGGRKIKRLALPLLFFLELATLLLLTIAAAQPFLPLASGAVPLVIVLDDSFSMRAGEPESPRDKGLRFLREDFDAGRISSVQFILAGDEPVLAGEADGGLEQLDSIDAVWHCADAGSQQLEAIALAMEVGGPRARILVVSDQEPAELPSQRVVWKAFGEPRDNLGFVTAVRSARREKQRVQLEVANFGSRSIEGSLVLSAGTTGGRTTPLALGAGEARRLSLEIPSSDVPIEATLSGDDLDFDNHVTLLPARPRDIRVDVSIANDSLSEPVEAALQATGRVEITKSAPDLIVTDQLAGTPRPGSWVVELRRGTSPVALGGPFLINSAHPLNAGISLGGVVWGSARGTLPGTPVISAGNTSLVTDEETGDGGHLVRISLNPGLSTLQRTPAWPALVWNLVDWRSRSVAGFRDPNIRVGAIARLTAPEEDASIEIVAPDGSRRTRASAGTIMVRASQPGIWSAVADETTFRFAANPIAPDESNLASARTGTWGSWTSEPAPGETTRDLAWLAALAAIAVLIGHQYLVAREAS